MKTTISAFAIVAALGLSGAAFGQVASGGGGSDAKGNAPVKASHTVNDGGARRGATSFTEGEARRHIVHAGYDSVTGLAKGEDGVWRGMAMKNGASINVGLDFKGNVSEGEAMASTTTSGMTSKTAMTAPEPAMSPPMKTTTTSADAAMAKPMHHRRHRRHRRHHMSHCANPTPSGAACSGVDRNNNGISDKEDRAIKGGAKL